MAGRPTQTETIFGQWLSHVDPRRGDHGRTARTDEATGPLCREASGIVVPLRMIQRRSRQERYGSCAEASPLPRGIRADHADAKHSRNLASARSLEAHCHLLLALNNRSGRRGFDMSKAQSLLRAEVFRLLLSHLC